MKNNETRFLSMMSLVEKIRGACRKNIEETSEDGSTLFYIPNESGRKVTLIMNHSTDRFSVLVEHPMIKARMEFSIKNTDILVGSSYLEVFETSDRFIHVDFDNSNIEKDKQMTAKRSKK